MEIIEEALKLIKERKFGDLCVIVFVISDGDLYIPEQERTRATATTYDDDLHEMIANLAHAELYIKSMMFYQPGMAAYISDTNKEIFNKFEGECVVFNERGEYSRYTPEST